MITPRWYSVAQVAEMLGFGLSKTKMLVATGELRLLKDGKYVASPGMGGRVRRTASEGHCAMTGRTRANGEGSIFAYRNGFAAYA